MQRLQADRFINYDVYENYVHTTEQGSYRNVQKAATGTPKPPSTDLDDVFISVKTTKKYHADRLSLIIKTWFQLAKNQVCFFFVGFVSNQN
jgi:hypothetical protein